MKLSLNPKYKGKGDRALTNNNIAEAYHWDIYQIENAPAEEILEMLIARKAISDSLKPKKVKKKKRKSR